MQYISIGQTAPLVCEQADPMTLADRNYAMIVALGKTRKIVASAEIDGDEKAELLAELDEIYQQLCESFGALLNDIGGQNN